MKNVIMMHLDKKLRERETIHITPDKFACASKIDDEAISSKKSEKKRALLREQINIRKDFKQKIKVPFTRNGKLRPLRDIITELSDFIAANTEVGELDSEICSGYTSDLLVGKQILHKFEVEGEERWFSGCVIGYNAPP